LLSMERVSPRLQGPGGYRRELIRSKILRDDLGKRDHQPIIKMQIRDAIRVAKGA
jgi:hypothetical protein